MKKSFILILFGSLLGNFAQAQTAAPVYITFEFRVASATNNIDNLPAVERDVAERLARKCATSFPYWPILPGDSNSYPALRVWLTKDGETEEAEWSIRMNLVLPKRAPKDSWKGTLFPVSTYTLLAGTLRDHWPEKVEQHFEDLLAVQSEAILTTLQRHAPLGRNLELRDPPELAPDRREYLVLPLGWQQYEPLSSSEFLIQCNLANSGGVVYLHSVGVARKADFTPTNRRFDGLAVRLREWEPVGGVKGPISSHLDEVKDLQPTFFFLKTYKELSLDWMVADH